MVKKRAKKKTETINYRREIWRNVVVYPLRTKDEICRMVKGNRKVVFRNINDLIDEKILEYDDGKLSITTENELNVKRSALFFQLENFRETRNNTIDQIKKRIKSAPVGKRSFFYQREFTYRKPKDQQWDSEDARNVAERLAREGIEKAKADGGEIGGIATTTALEEGWLTTKIDYINDDAKSWIFMIPQLIDGLVRSSFSLYTSQMLRPVSVKTYREIFEKDIRTAVIEIDKTKKMLLKIMLEFSKNKKNDTKFFHQWWAQITYGLTLEFETVIYHLDKVNYAKPKE